MSAHPDWYVIGGLLRKLFDGDRKKYHAFLESSGMSSSYAIRIRSLHAFLSNGREHLTELGVGKCLKIMVHERAVAKSQVAA